MKAAQAEGVARIKSSPSMLSDEAAGKNNNGTASTTLAAAGKMIWRESVTLVLRYKVELQDR